MIDCDCTYFPEDIPAVLAGMEDRDMIVGIRSMRDVRFSHRLVNHIHTGLVNRLSEAVSTTSTPACGPCGWRNSPES